MLLLTGKKSIRLFLIISFFFLTTFNLKKSNYFNSFFKIQNIIFNKSYYLEENIKVKLINILRNKSLIFINLKTIQDLFYESSWIYKIQFKKKFPNDLIINVTEFRPVGYYKKNNKIYIVNSGFSKISSYNNIENLYNLIELENIVDIKKLELFYKVINQQIDLFDKINKIIYKSNNRWDIVLKDKKLIKFGESELNNQIKKIYPFIMDQNIHTIDLRIKNRITIGYVK